MQTTATFDPKEDCFIIHTPTIRDAKFWPGELGKLCTHAVVQANTYTKGKSIGIQTFLIQIRDMNTHRPLPGLEIGDIGPKYGYATKDNGYMVFNNYKVPRSALLSRFSKITKEGDFSVLGNPRVAYQAMMLIRVQLLESAPAFMYKSLMIALRYIVNRKQFKSIPNSLDERKIIDYQASKTKIASALAFGWASRFTSFKCNDMYDKMVKEIAQNKFKTMKDLHSFGCALKAYYCDEVVNQQKDLRELMGAHGYLNGSEMTDMIEMVGPIVTLEGDSCVMYQQTAKDIFKTVGKLLKGGTIKGTYAYLEQMSDYIETECEDLNIENTAELIDVLKAATVNQIVKVGNELRKSEKYSFDEKWNKVYLSEIIKTAKLHSIYSTAAIFLESLSSYEISPNLLKHLQVLCDIYVCENIIKNGDQALMSGYITGSQLLQINERLEKLINEIRPQFVPLVESASLHKKSISGVISQMDGKYSERLYEFASNRKLNQKDMLHGTNDYIKPLHRKLMNFSARI